MPQGRHKVPFSAKQKKTQLQEKRNKKRDNLSLSNIESGPSCAAGARPGEALLEFVAKAGKPITINESLAERGKDPNRYKLLFKKEDQEQLRKKREEAHIPFESLPEPALEVSYDEFYIQGSEMDLPKRPPWDYRMEKKLLESNEERYFRNYVDGIRSRFPEEDLSYFELNLETWRQLWRVLEMADILLLIADIRHPVLHFPPALYSHVTEDLGKDIILVLNKADLVEPSLVLAWKQYFQEQFPRLHLLCFSAFGGMAPTTSKRGRRKGKLRMAAEGAHRLLATCQKIVNGKVDLSTWERKIDEELVTAIETEGDDEEELNALANAPTVHIQGPDTSHYREDKYAGGVLTLGFVGHPNVGKSSLLNSIMGRKVVSVSRTPGHTKHFQTIFLTPEVRLCDCPGLVFPSRVPKAMQVLSGCYPIAQLREPYSAVAYLAQRVDLQKFLRLKHPQQEPGSLSPPWSSYDVCEAWAIERGFRTARAARPDVHRSANHLLRMALDGRSLCLHFYPPGYTNRKEYWRQHPELGEVKKLQGKSKTVEEDFIPAPSSSSSSNDEGLGDEPTTANNKFALLSEEQ